MNGSKWNQNELPHKGWACVDVIDLDVDCAKCEMCGNERIRYVHIMKHEDYEYQLEVGCICAEKMSDDYVGPKKRESTLRNIALRRKRWIDRKWRISTNGNAFLNVEGWNMVVFMTKSRGWSYRLKKMNHIGEIVRFSKYVYRSQDDAKLALFDEFFR